MRKCLFVLMMLLFAGVAVQGQGTDGYKCKLAVYVTGRVNGVTIDVDTEMGIEMTAVDLLVNSGKFEMINRSSIYKEQVTNEIKEQQGGDVRDEDVAALGESYGAQKICVVLFLANTTSKDLKVNARVIDVQSKKTDFSCMSTSYDFDGSARSRDEAVSDAMNKILVSLSSCFCSSQGVVKPFTVNGVRFNMVLVKGGSMYLGCTMDSEECNKHESPSHRVTLSDYYMGETEVTQALWKAVMGDNNNPSKWKGDQLPVETVSWNDCQEFCLRLNKLCSSQLPQGYRFALPSEAQWEYAARGGSNTNAYDFSGGNDLENVAWWVLNSDGVTHAVGVKRPNELGLYDMSGNIDEWCEDIIDHTYYSVNSDWTDPVNTSADAKECRVLRGGGFYSMDDCRVAYRGYGGPDSAFDGGGLRLALVRR